MNDYDLLVRASNKLTQRIRSAFGVEASHIERINMNEHGTQLEKLMYGDLVDCDQLDIFTRQAAKSHLEGVEKSDEVYDVGSVTGLIEQAIIVGVLFERERVRQVRAGQIPPKVGDGRDYGC